MTEKRAEYRRLTWPLFLELIRLPAKAASLLPFLIGVAYAHLAFDQLNWVNTAIYFVGQMSIAFFVTGFNNVQDFYKAKDTHYRDTQNIIGRERLSPQRILALMVVFLVVACMMGVLLVVRTNLSLLFIGGAAIFVAIFYTYGPVPLSRVPSGEFFAGMCEGFGTIFIAVFVNVVPQPAMMILDWSCFAVSFNLATVLRLFVVALPVLLLDANVMFTDNICDINQDVRNDRYTLPYYLTKAHALQIYPYIPVAIFGSIVLGVVVGYLPWPLLLTLVLIPHVAKNTRTFMAAPSKRETFASAINSLLAVDSALFVLMVVASIWW